MLSEWYRNTIGRFVFRKLNLGIGLSLLLVFLLIGFLTYNRFYNLLEEKANDLLKIRTDTLQEQLVNMITQFKRETISFYPLSSETPGFYSRFLPGGVPKQEQGQLSERNFFNGLQSYLLERNPSIMSVFMYRSADGKLYYKDRYPSAELDDGFEFTGFFASFPKNYDYPYIGQTDRLYSNINRRILYFVTPVFDFANIRYNNVQGYFMVAIDSKTLFDRYQPDKDKENRILIRQRGKVLLDSQEGADLPKSGILQTISSVPRYQLQVVGMVNKSSIQSKLSQITLLIVGGLLAAWILCMLLIHYIQRFVILRLKSMTQHFKRVQTNPFTEPMEEAGDDEIGDLISRFNRMTRELQDYINRVYIADMQKSNAEFLALKMQINPHFLYNTLESLRMQAVIRKQPDIADKLFYLGRLYRWILKTGSEEIPVEEELQYTRYYLDLFMMGKSKQIELETITDLDLRECYLPKFCLQPIVENAILHGQLEKADKPVITLSIRLEDDAQLVEITNNGQGAPLEQLLKLNDSLRAKNIFQKEHLGLKNIHERIRSYYGDPYGLFVKTTRPQDGFTLLMRLPRDRASSQEEQNYGKAVDRR